MPSARSPLPAGPPQHHPSFFVRGTVSHFYPGRSCGRPPVAPGKEGTFRHYFFRQAWWDFQVIGMEVLESMAELSKPVMDWASRQGAKTILMRAFLFPRRTAAMLTIALWIAVALLPYGARYLASQESRVGIPTQGQDRGPINETGPAVDGKDP
jgi:hypothetical protein